MKNRKSTLGILLDTTFLLPTLGIDVGDEVKDILRRLDEIKVEFYYSQFSILESLWIAVRLIKNGSFDKERFNLGLRSIAKSNRYIAIGDDHRVYEEALKLYMLGHRDMIDNILYATSLIYDLKLLTMDSKFDEFIRDKGLKNTLLLPGKGSNFKKFENT